MNEYLVHYNGSIQVSAENAEEAKEKVRKRPKHDLIIEDYEPEALSPENDRFQLKLSRVGHNMGNATYNLMTDTGALNLALRAVNAIADRLVGKSNAPNFKYDLACLMLASLEGDSVNKDEIWEAVQDIDKNVHEEGMDWVRNLWTFKSNEEGSSSNSAEADEE